MNHLSPDTLRCWFADASSSKAEATTSEATPAAVSSAGDEGWDAIFVITKMVAKLSKEDRALLLASLLEDEDTE